MSVLRLCRSEKFDELRDGIGEENLSEEEPAAYKAGKWGTVICRDCGLSIDYQQKERTVTDSCTSPRSCGISHGRSTEKRWRLHNFYIEPQTNFSAKSGEISMSQQLGGQPILILKEGSSRTRGRDAQGMNITAAKAVA
ncbi:MAG TPA: hypothetical protein P5217_01380, partial [Methanoregulaceae archaeon]|nr:hypothetical protein [Methanoregulaceae archaeon]